MAFQWDPDNESLPRSDISSKSFSEDSIGPDSLSDISDPDHETMETLHQSNRLTKATRPVDLSAFMFGQSKLKSKEKRDFFHIYSRQSYCIR